MSTFNDTQLKIANVQKTIDSLLEGSFPIDAGERALLRLKKVFDDINAKLLRAQRLKNEESINDYANITNLKILQVLPVLGFLLRSTNVRNPFELLYPFQALAKTLLQGGAPLIISSEWDFVPFAYPQSMEDLKSFVLIGMPASESGNALLTPLAAHELGHAVWRNRGIGGQAHTTLQFACENAYDNNKPEFVKVFADYDPNDMIYKYLLPEAIGQSTEYAVRQAEELFCDLFAYALFGESYLHAFGYILSPGEGNIPGPKYPTHKTRVSVMGNIAGAEGVSLPDLKALGLADAGHTGSAQERFIVRMAESIVEPIVPGLWSTIVDLFRDKQVERPSNGFATRHLSEFRLGVPAHDPRCMGDVLNAAWTYYKDSVSTLNGPQIISKSEHLNEMIYKSIEVLEYKRRAS